MKRSVAPRGARATALTWFVPRPKQQGVGDRGLTESARRADPRAPADRAPCTPRAIARGARPAHRPPARGGARERRALIDARGREEETADSHKHRTSPPLLSCGGENHPDHALPHVPASAPRGRRRSRYARAGGGSHGTERRAKRRRDTTRRGDGPKEHGKNLPCYLDGHSTSARAHEPTARRTRTVRRRSARASTQPPQSPRRRAVDVPLP